MRDRRDSRDLSPKYRDRRHRHVDRHGDATRHHQPPPRLVRLSGSPPARAPHPHPHRRSPHRRDLMPRQLDRCKPVHRDHLSPHHPRSRHSPTGGEYHRDLHVPSYMHPDYPTELSHGIKHQPHGLGLEPQPMAAHKAVFLDDRPIRSYPTTLKQESMLTGGAHNSELLQRHSRLRDPYGGDRDRDRDRHRDRDREMGRGLYQREASLPVTVSPPHLVPIDGGPSSYAHGRLHYDRVHAAPEDISRVTLGRLPDILLTRRESRDWVGDRYNNLVPDDMCAKMPYTSLGYSRVDGMAFSPRSLREGRIFTDLPHNSTHRDTGPVYHGFEQGYSPRPLHRREAALPFKDGYEFGRDSARMAQRERPASPIFADRGKGLHRPDYMPPCNGYVDDLAYEPSHERLMGREHHVRHVHDHDHDSDHGIYDDRIFDDDDDNDDAADDDGDEDGHGFNQRRVTVKDRLNLTSPQNTDVDQHKIRRPVSSRKPVVVCGKHNHSYTMAAPAVMRTNSVKKRLQPGPSDFRKENFRAYKLQKRGMEDEPNSSNVNYENEKGFDEDAACRVSPINRDPPEGSEDFKRQVEKAFLKYARIINESSREKKKFLQPGRGGLVCYVCGRSVFFSLH